MGPTRFLCANPLQPHDMPIISQIEISPQQSFWRHITTTSDIYMMMGWQFLLFLFLRETISSPTRSPTKLPTNTPTSLPTPASSICPFGFDSYYNLKCYKLSDFVASWDAATIACQYSNSWLVTVTSLQEHNFLLERYGVASKWIGLNDKDKEGRYVWSNSEAVTYTKWARSQPDSTGDCVYMWSSFGGDWDDTKCNTKMFFVCEVNSLTASPTKQPTLVPTALPSMIPTFLPSLSPTTAAPTSTPFRSPFHRTLCLSHHRSLQSSHEPGLHRGLP
jgi:hypothetical protein